MRNGYYDVSGTGPGDRYPVLLIALFADIKERPRDSKNPAGLTDVAAQNLRMLQHAQAGLHPALPGSACILDASSRTSQGAK